MEKQVDKKVYNFKKYCTLDRWASYWYQINEVLDCEPNNVLEIGVGDKVLANYLKTNTDVDYKSLDLAEDLQPDFLASVDDMKVLQDNSFDVACAFEVLEHLPFEKFERALNELKRVSRKKVIISLPHWGRHFSFKLRLPFFKVIKFQYKLNCLPLEHEFNGQHYWEIGKKGYNLNLIKSKIIEAGFEIVNDYIAFEMPYHHFFILKKIIIL